jgi:hypothetical protein
VLRKIVRLQLAKQGVEPRLTVAGWRRGGKVSHQLKIQDACRPFWSCRAHTAEIQKSVRYLRAALLRLHAAHRFVLVCAIQRCPEAAAI